jgi:hypothetical protein
VSPRWMASDDEGRRFVGHEAIRRWSDREFIVARGRMTVTGVSNTKSGVTINADWKGDTKTSSTGEPSWAGTAVPARPEKRDPPRLHPGIPQEVAANESQRGPKPPA